MHMHTHTHTHTRTRTHARARVHTHKHTHMYTGRTRFWRVIDPLNVILLKTVIPLSYILLCANKLDQLVIQVQYHMNVNYTLGDGHIYVLCKC